MAHFNGREIMLAGLKGDSCFIRYSASADGTAFTEKRSEGQNYIGIACGQTAPTDKSAYDWMRIQTSENILPLEGKQYTVAAVDENGNVTPLAVDVGGYGFAIPLRETGGRLRVPAPTIDGHAINRGYLNERLSPLEERISVLEDKSKEFVTVEGENEVIEIPSGAKQYAQILEIHGQWSLYPLYSVYCDYVKNYPKRILTDTDKVLFEMPEDVESRLTDFGIRYNYLSFDDGKVFYHQGARIGEYYEQPQDGETYGEDCEDSYRTFKFNNEIVTDVSDYISFDGTIDISGAKQIIVEMKHSEDAVNAMISNPDDVEMNRLYYRVGKTKFVFEV